MDIYGVYKQGISFNEFVNQDSDTYKEKTLEILNTIEFEESLLEAVKNIDRVINVMVCAEIWCPDCMINVPVLAKMQQYNENINLSIVPKEGHEDVFKTYAINDVIRIPTFVFYDEEWNELGHYVEHPQKIKDIVAKGNQPTVIVAKRKYRKGEYAKETLKDILKIVQ